MHEPGLHIFLRTRRHQSRRIPYGLHPASCLWCYSYAAGDDSFQPGKLKPKDLKEAIRRTRAERQRQLQEQEALRSLTLTASTEPDHDDGNGGSGGRSGRGDPSHPGGRQIADTLEGERGLQQERLQQPAQLGGRAICAYEATGVGGGDGRSGAATRQLKEMSFLQDLADTESEERDRSFKVNMAARFCHTSDYSINQPQLVGLERVCVDMFACIELGPCYVPEKINLVSAGRFNLRPLSISRAKARGGAISRAWLRCSFP